MVTVTTPVYIYTTGVHDAKPVGDVYVSPLWDGGRGAARQGEGGGRWIGRRRGVAGAARQAIEGRPLFSPKLFGKQCAGRAKMRFCTTISYLVSSVSVAPNCAAVVVRAALLLLLLMLWCRVVTTLRVFVRMSMTTRQRRSSFGGW